MKVLLTLFSIVLFSCVSHPHKYIGNDTTIVTRYPLAKILFDSATMTYSVMATGSLVGTGHKKRKKISTLMIGTAAIDTTDHEDWLTENPDHAKLIGYSNAIPGKWTINTYDGRCAGRFITSGEYETLIGRYAGANVITGSYNTVFCDTGAILTADTSFVWLIDWNCAFLHKHSWVVPYLDYYNTIFINDPYLRIDTTFRIKIAQYLTEMLNGIRN